MFLMPPLVSFDAIVLVLPAWAPAAIAIAVSVLGTLATLIGVFGPTIRRWVDENVSQKDVETLKGVVKGAYVVVAKIAEATPGFTLDDALAKVLEMATREFELARGRPPTAAEVARMRMMALSRHADPAQPNLTPTVTAEDVKNNAL